MNSRGALAAAAAPAAAQPPRFDDACGARNVRISSLYGRRISCSRSAHSLTKAARTFAVVADMVAVDGVVKTAQNPPEEPLVNAGQPEPPTALQEAKSILSDVTNLVKLVDSKDIVELELKHKDYEIVIRKAEALKPPPAPPVAPIPYPGFAAPFPGYAPAAPPAPLAAAPVADSAPSTAPAALPALPAAPQYPPLLSPMAGNFYRSPGPGEPPFVKVGDKVRKGQVLCIIEAMKLMNEIESDQDGTLVEVVAEDGKPIATDAPLFVIKP